MGDATGAARGERATTAASWEFVRDPYRPQRRPTRVVHVGDVAIGGPNPIRIQSMTVADTLDTAAVVDEICALHAAGCEIVRVTAPNRKSAENLGIIKHALARRGVRVPLVADIHFTPQAALIAALAVEKVRINPGNYADRKRFQPREYTEAEYASELSRLEEAFRPLVLRCKERGVAMRIGTNHGSLSDRIVNRYGDTPLGMVESALEFVRICELHGYRALVLSMKASDVKVMVEAYRLLALRTRALGMDYPFHLGVTEAGGGLSGRLKSAAGIGALLADGLGDTIRVSLTEDSVHELPVARRLAGLALPVSSAARSSIPSPVHERPPWDALRYDPPAVATLGTGGTALGSRQPPRIEVALPASVGISGTGSLDAELFPRPSAGQDESQPDLVLLQYSDPRAGWGTVGALGAAVETAASPGRAGFGIEVPLAWFAEPLPREVLRGWARLAIAVDRVDALADAPAPEAPLPPLQYTLRVDPSDPDFVARSARELAACWDRSGWPRGAVALVPLGARGTVVQGALGPLWRRFLAAWPARPLPPVVLRADIACAADGRDARGEGLELAAHLGALLADGVGNAVQLAVPEGAAVRPAAGLAAEILQALRLRLVRADFIACPSCGRTQFELQATTARIEARLRHLHGLKIAVMGCIVNGPGEMADADFGYVGSGPGRIDLYAGRERVVRNVPQEEAVERLVELIRSHGRWVEPETGSASPGGEPT